MDNRGLLNLKEAINEIKRLEKIIYSTTEQYKAEIDRLNDEVLYLKKFAPTDETEYSDRTRKELFKGTALDYVLMRATKHQLEYGTTKDRAQANHLRNLVEDEIQEKENLKSRNTALEKVVAAVRGLWDAYGNSGHNGLTEEFFKAWCKAGSKGHLVAWWQILGWKNHTEKTIEALAKLDKGSAARKEPECKTCNDKREVGPDRINCPDCQPWHDAKWVKIRHNPELVKAYFKEKGVRKTMQESDGGYSIQQCPECDKGSKERDVDYTCPKHRTSVPSPATPQPEFQQLDTVNNRVELEKDNWRLRFKCCDCGLIHMMSFAIEDNGNLGIAIDRETQPCPICGHSPKCCQGITDGDCPKCSEGEGGNTKKK